MKDRNLARAEPETCMLPTQSSFIPALVRPPTRSLFNWIHLIHRQRLPAAHPAVLRPPQTEWILSQQGCLAGWPWC
eukprot:scaffold110401_cov38-Prasinocladus_malaysianus.AAC.1